MAKKPAKKSAKTLGKQQMKKTAGGYSGGVRVAVGDVNGDGSVSGVDLLKVKVAPGGV